MSAIFFILLFGAIAYYFFTKKEVVCKDCGYVGKLNKSAGGNLLIEIILWCCFLIPGIIYSIWSVSNKKYTCPTCSGHNLIPTNSPIGSRLTDKISPVSNDEIQAQPKLLKAEHNEKRTLGFMALAFILICGYAFSALPDKDSDKAEGAERAVASSSVVKKSAAIENLLAASKAKYEELCSEKTNGECLYLANHTKNKKIKRLLAVHICLSGEVDNDMEPCGLIAFLEDDPKIYSSIIEISCLEYNNLKECIPYANGLINTGKQSDKKIGRDLLAKLCTDGLVDACKYVKR